MPDNVLSFDEIKNFEQKLLLLAKSIRTKVNSIDMQSRRKLVSEFSNQYEIDVVADKAIDEYFSDFPGYLLSEERPFDKEQIEQNDLVLIIDPIDGSSNASRSIGYWSFSAALAYRGKIQLGVVVDQVQNIIFTANEYEEARIIISKTNQNLLLANNESGQNYGSKSNNFSSSIVCLNSHDGPDIPFRHLRNLGSSALSICHVASGSLDAYIDGEDVMLKPWDLLASEYIAQKSNCYISRRDSNGIFAATGVLIAKNKNFFGELTKIFNNFS